MYADTPTTSSPPLGIAWLAMFTFLALLVVVAPPQLAAAMCIAPIPQILWSHPRNGATAVATDTDLWVSGVFGRPTLNGRVLQPNGSGGFDLGELAPNSQFEIGFESLAPATGTPSTPLSIVFSTGAEPAAAAALDIDDPPQIVRNPVALADCPLVPPQDCFDTFPGPESIRFDPGPTPLAWVIERLACDGSNTTLVWPAECGPPVVVAYDPVVCVRLSKTDGVHMGTSTDVYCSEPKLPPGVSPARNSSCVGEWPPSSAISFTSVDGDAVPAMAGAAAGNGGPAMTALPSGPDASAGCAVAAPQGTHSGRATLIGSALLATVVVLLARRSAQKPQR